MISREDLIALFERMARENWDYLLGAAKEGCVDCSGAFVYAYKQLGGPSIEHGSNSIFQLRIGSELPMSQAKPGYAAFKVRPWTEDEKDNRWYGYDPGDVYHIGLVGNDGKILNAQGTKTGFVSSDSDTWDLCAPLLAVSYLEEEEDYTVLYTAKVITEKDPLNMRSAPTTQGKLITKIPKGATVEVLEVLEGWSKVKFGGFLGYSSSQYLQKENTSSGSEDSVEDTTGSVEGITVTVVDVDGNRFTHRNAVSVEFE